MRTAAFNEKSNVTNTGLGLGYIVHELLPRHQYKAWCGISFMPYETHEAPCVVQCLWCLARRPRRIRQ